MIHIRFELIKHGTGGSTEIVGQAEIQIEQPGLEITPELLRTHIQSFDPAGDYGFNAYLACNNVLITVRGFTYFTLAAFANTRPQLATLKVIGASRFFRLNNLDISRLDSEQSNALVADCNIKEFNVGIETMYKKAMAKTKAAGADSRQTTDDEVDTDLRGTMVDRVRIFSPQRKVNIQRCRAGTVEFERDCHKIADFHVWEESDISYLVLAGSFDLMKIDNSRITTTSFRKNVCVHNLEVNASVFVEAHGCQAATFAIHSLDSWQLVMKASQVGCDVEAYADAGYHYARLRGRRHRAILAKVTDRLLDCSCGYGFRPARTAVLATSVWLVWAIGYWAISLTTGLGIVNSSGPGDDWLLALGRSLYFSAITLTTVGFGDIAPQGWPSMLMSGLEGAIGIVIFALLVFSLTKKYSSY